MSIVLSIFEVEMHIPVYFLQNISISLAFHYTLIQLGFLFYSSNIILKHCFIGSQLECYFRKKRLNVSTILTSKITIKLFFEFEEQTEKWNILCYLFDKV